MPNFSLEGDYSNVSSVPNWLPHKYLRLVENDDFFQQFL